LITRRSLSFHVGFKSAAQLLNQKWELILLNSTRLRVSAALLNESRKSRTPSGLIANLVTDLIAIPYAKKIIISFKKTFRLIPRRSLSFHLGFKSAALTLKPLYANLKPVYRIRQLSI